MYLTTTRLDLMFVVSWVSDLNGFTDSNYAGDMEDSNSTSGYVFMMSGGAIVWSSRKQPIVILSTTEAEFVAGRACTC